MTADVNANVNVDENGSSDEVIKDTCGLDVISHQDLPNAAPPADFKDDADGSYVFVDGNDVVAEDDLVPTADLNANVILQNEEKERGGAAAFDQPNPPEPVAHSEPEAFVNDVQEALESRANVSESVQFQPESLQVNGGMAHCGEEDRVETKIPVPIQASHNTCTAFAEIEVNQSENKEEERVDGANKSDLVTDIEEIHGSDIIAAEGVKITALVSDLEKEPVGLKNEGPVPGPEQASGVQLEQNLETAPCLEVADVKAEGSEAVNIPTSDESADYFPASHAQDGVAETGFLNDLVDANQKKAEQCYKAVPWSVSDSETDNSLPTTNVDDVTEALSDPNSKTSVQLDDEVSNGHASPEKGKVLHSDHTHESVSEIIIGDDFDRYTQDTPEPHRFSDISKSLPSPVSDETVPAENCENTPIAPISGAVIEPDLETGDSSLGTTNDKTNDVRAEIEVESLDVNSSDSVGSLSLGDTKFEIQAENGSVDSNKSSSCLASNVEPATVTESISHEYRAKETTSSSGVLEIKSKFLEAQAGCDSVENKCDLLTYSADGKTDLDVENTLSAPSKDMPEDSVIASERNLNFIQDDVHLENEGDVSVNDDEKTGKVMEAVGVPRDETSTVDAFDGQNAAFEVGKRPFFYMIKIPRYDDENLKEQIKHALLHVDEKTKSRDAIRDEIRIKKAISNEYGDKFEAAKSEENAARDFLKAKRKEIDSLQSLINIEDVDGRIRNLEHMLQHETLPLKEEKQFIREIKQLRQLREQLSSHIGSQVQHAVDHKDQVEERLKALRKEADSLREKVFKAEAVTKDARKKYSTEKQKLNDLQRHFAAADIIRQKAYEHFLILKKNLNEKNRHFWKYKGDANAAKDLAMKGNKEELQHLCISQVEEIMEIWNCNEEFRKDYIRCNMRSTLRRLRTLDGRSLGPDEEPPEIPNFIVERVAKDNVEPSITTTEGGKQVAHLDEGKAIDNPIAKIEDQKKQIKKSKKPAKLVSSVERLAAVSNKDEIEETKQEELKPAKEEELVKKAEALRREEEAAMLKEQRRLEEKAKAIEAMERKKRNADKAEARAALRAQKEAEQKEKEREKRARKKERKMAVVSGEDMNAGNINEDEAAAPNSETPTETRESEMGEKQPVIVTKRPQKPSQLARQTKAKSIMPLPLRNRSKRKMQTWMWALLTALLVFALFLIGNSGFSFTFGLQRFGF